MRRILADRVVLADQLDIKPVGDQHVLKIPEPNITNLGPTGFYGVGNRVRSRQSMTVEVQESGDYINYFPDSGARFSLLPDFLENEDNVEICDEYNKVGGEWANIPHYSQVLLAYDNDVEYASVKMIRLQKWKDRTPAYGVEGMMFAVRYEAGVAQVHIWDMRVYQDHGGLATGDMSYQWVYRATASDQIAVTAANISSLDAIELDDGSIVLVITDDTEILAYKSFDQGATWVQTGQLSSLTSDQRLLAIERIGSTLVVCYARSNAGDIEVYSTTSVDGGYTWSLANVITVGVAGTGVPKMDLQRGQDGILYLLYRHSDLVYSAASADGVNWSTPGTTGQACMEGVTLTQEYDGTWHMYSIEDDGGSPYEVFHTYQEDATDPDNSGWDGKNNFNFGCADADGMDSADVCARTFHDSAFIDVAVIYKDTDTGTTYYNIVIHRASMWTGVQLYPTADLWLRMWTANCFPSTADGHPNTNWWTRTQGGTGAAALAISGEFGELQLTGPGLGDDLFYDRAMVAGSFDTGATFAFEMQVVAGDRNRVGMRITDNPNGDAFVQISFSETDIELYDVNGTAIRQTFTPTNWLTTDYNYYVLVMFEDQVRMYRAPSSDYRDFAHMELVLTYDTLNNPGYTGDLDEITWGVINAGTPDSDSNWRCVAYTEIAVAIDWDFDTDLRGRKCHHNAVGIMEGFGCKWAGEFARLGDDWEFKTGAHYESENIFVDSPRIRWQEPIITAQPSDAQVFEWERGTDHNGNDMHYNFNAFSVFGRNWMQCKLEGGDAGGGGWATLFDSSVTEKTYMSIHTISAIDQNLITFTPAPYENMIPEQFASDDFRKYYIRFASGLLDGRVYRILGNNTTQLFMEEDIETVGAAADDSFVIFTDRFFYEFAAMQTYERLRLTIASTRTSPTEAQLRLGTIIIGRSYPLKDDMWESSIAVVPNVKVTAGRSKVQAVDEMGQEQRIVNVKYTGHIGRGMGITDPSQLWRFLRQSVHPMVWVDDDAGLDADTDYVFHEPILVRRMGESAQSRLCYSVETQRFVSSNVDWRRSMWEEMIRLEEVL